MDWGSIHPSPFGWFLYTLGAVYLVLFVYFFFTLTWLRRQATRQGGPAVERYNRMLRGFPNGFYAKMMGHKRL